MVRKIDDLREFILTYPRWDDFGIAPPADISLDRFSSADETAQLALTMTGNDIVRGGGDRVWEMDVRGFAAVSRQADFKLRLLCSSGTNAQREAANEFLLDFTGWLDEMNVRREVPFFGNDADRERTWASGGGFSEEREGGKRGVYSIDLHKIYTVSFDEEM